ncbi:unnamed protein product [Psylliodes chrysocephalus]|uniref:DUF659 domain-containing protein n=1 Tax=Psylliodes chrysocephalus TaxID=3402493 RepID=A0A9P0GBG6_9CUCU|nr:unnamed protein product [Psylliodes chrysocephala]
MKLTINLCVFQLMNQLIRRGRYIANFIIGALDKNRFINDSLTNFYLPKQVPTNNILLMVTDAAAYMVKAAGNQKIFYTNLIHCTCLAHGLIGLLRRLGINFHSYMI